MKLLFIRHGDPDYEHDCVTEKGKREIQLLAEKLKEMQIDDVYISPLGRARETASATLSQIKKEGIICSWLREFDALVTMPGTQEKHLSFDFTPAFIEKHPMLYDANKWLKEPLIVQSDVPKRYLETCNAFDELLARYGYIRDGLHYRVVTECRKTLVFFCHFGITGVLLSHLFHFSPICFLQHFFSAPTAIASVYSEEREKGIASFRCFSFGDISHLTIAGETPSVSGSFCEVYSDFSARH